MKLKDLISISKTAWLTGYQKTIEKGGLSKKPQVFGGLLSQKAEIDLLQEVYGVVSEKTKRTYNQTTSTLYKELLTYLHLQHRHYSEHVISQVKKALAKGDEKTFLGMSAVAEKILTDAENFESLLILNGILTNYYRLKSVELPEYQKQVEKRKRLLDCLTRLNDLETYFLNNDLLRKKRTNKLEEVEFQRHCSFLESHFASTETVRIQIQSRILWLRFIYQFHTIKIDSEQAIEIVDTIRKMLKSKPYLSFHLPESIEYALVSFTIHTDQHNMSESEFQALLETYYNTFDEEWLKRIFPNTYWSLLTLQVKYYMELADLLFVDDAKELDPIVRNGMTRLLERVVSQRNDSVRSGGKERHFGLLSEALCRFQLGGDQIDKACGLLEAMLVQEQQTRDARLQHTMYFNLCQFYFLSKKWDQMMDTREKYLRFTTLNGEFDKRSSLVMEFQYVISQLMHKEKTMTTKELEEYASNLFKGYEPVYDSFVPYVLKSLRLT